MATDDGRATPPSEIRKGVKFHDGTPLTAADVATSWQYIVHPAQGRVERARELHGDGQLGGKLPIPRPWCSS